MLSDFQAMFALKALNGVVPGFEKAKLRNFGMTIGTRDSRNVIISRWLKIDNCLLNRKIIGRYDLTSEDVRSQAKFDDTIGVFPEFIGDKKSFWLRHELKELQYVFTSLA